MITFPPTPPKILADERGIIVSHEMPQPTLLNADGTFSVAALDAGGEVILGEGGRAEKRLSTEAEKGE